MTLKEMVSTSNLIFDVGISRFVSSRTKVWIKPWIHLVMTMGGGVVQRRLQR